MRNGDDPNLLNLPDAPWTRTLSIGVNDSNDLVIDNFKENSKGSSFDLVWREQQVREINWSMPGLFNARNLAMAYLSSAIAQSLDRDLSGILENPFCGIKKIDYGTCLGVKRRQEVLVNRDDLVVLSDFAHHPTAITGRWSLCVPAGRRAKLSPALSPAVIPRLPMFFRNDLPRLLP